MARDVLIDAFDAVASACETLAQLKGQVEDAARDLGFDYVALLHHANPGQRGRGHVRIDNYPPAWKARLRGGALIARDPVHRACARTLTGFAWDAIGAFVALSRPVRDLFELSRAFGLGEGFTIPAHMPGEPSGSCSFVTRAGRALPRRSLLCAEQLGLHAFEAARRLSGLVGRDGPPPHFSRRELDALRLVAAGKTDWEIARILGLGHETVRQYVKQAREVYGVATRTQLVVHALRDGVIGFDEALRPPGS